MIKFFRNAFSEIHNVTWPSKKHAKHISTVAIIFTFASAAFIWFTDYILDKWIKWVVLSNTPIQQAIPVKKTPIKASNIKVKTIDWKDVKVDVNNIEKTSK